MARKKKPAARGPSNAYLLSFGDTMTTLLAFFIVLNSLASEQTGANLYRGTGSFVRAMKAFGLPGSLAGERSQNAIAKDTTNPLYVAEDPNENPPENDPSGPDREDNGLRVIDREMDEFDRFVNEMNRSFDVQQLSSTRGEAVFDFFEPLNSGSPMLTKKHLEALGPIIPRLHDPSFRVELVVWATTPSGSAMRRAAVQSHQIGKEVARLGRLPPQSRARLTAVGRPWFDAVAKRPVMSVVLRKVNPPSPPSR